MRITALPILSIIIFLLTESLVRAEPGGPQDTDLEIVIYFSAGAIFVVILPLLLGALTARHLFRLHWRRPLFYLVLLLVAIPLAAFGLFGTVLVGFGLAGRTM